MTDFADRYVAAMNTATDTYQDVLDALNAAEIPATLTQTGGMCLAITFPWRDGAEFLLCDKDDSLSWERAETDGWAVGLYDYDGVTILLDGEPVLTDDHKRPDTAVTLVMSALRAVKTPAPWI
jgi:hypothetical protein